MRMLSEIKYDNTTFLNRNIARSHRYGIENKIEFILNNQFIFLIAFQ